MEDNLCKYMNCSNCNLIDCLDGCEDISSCQECKDKMLSAHDKQIRNEVIDKVIELIDAYPNDLDRKTEETHLIFATLSDIITHIRQMKESD